MRRPECRADAGFTLVELLVSLVLFAMLAGALFAALRGGAFTLDRVAADSAGTGGLEAADDVLRRGFLSAYPRYVPGPQAGMTGAVVFDGRPGAVEFLAPAPAALAPGGFARVAIGAVGDLGRKNLVIAARPDLAWPDEAAALREVLAPGVAGVTFAYYGAVEAGAAPYWHAAWQDRPALPVLIRVSVAFPAGDPRRWPDMIFSTAIRADQACQFAPLTQSCLGR